ncbi:MAG: hypothetical protein IT438_02745 [Phycisphaerales bacterium]|nr:hypothetical protein [Phycisphaerales bacterium]
MLRQALEKRPMLGWALAAVLMLVAAVFVYRHFTGGETLELSRTVTIRCSETGATWEMTRGAMEKELYMRPLPLKPDEGLINPETGKRTGFPVDDWKETLERITADRDAFSKSRGGNTPQPVKK